MLKGSAHYTHHQPIGSELIPSNRRHFGPRACKPRRRDRCLGRRLRGRGRGTWPTADLRGWGASWSVCTGTILHLQEDKISCVQCGVLKQTDKEHKTKKSRLQQIGVFFPHNKLLFLLLFNSLFWRTFIMLLKSLKTLQV